MMPLRVMPRGRRSSYRIVALQYCTFFRLCRSRQLTSQRVSNNSITVYIAIFSSGGAIALARTGPGARHFADRTSTRGNTRARLRA